MPITKYILVSGFRVLAMETTITLKNQVLVVLLVLGFGKTYLWFSLARSWVLAQDTTV